MFRDIVIKIPNFRYQWGHFLKGLLANMSERDSYRWNSGKYERGSSHLLCPVVWSSWGGWILVMKRADTKTLWENLYEEIVDYTPWIAAGFGGDDKVDNYGILDGRVVKIDYGS